MENFYQWIEANPVGASLLAGIPGAIIGVFGFIGGKSLKAQEGEVSRICDIIEKLTYTPGAMPPETQISLVGAKPLHYKQAVEHLLADRRIKSIIAAGPTLYHDVQRARSRGESDLRTKLVAVLNRYVKTPGWVDGMLGALGSRVRSTAAYEAKHSTHPHVSGERSTDGSTEKLWGFPLPVSQTDADSLASDLESLITELQPTVNEERRVAGLLAQNIAIFDDLRNQYVEHARSRVFPRLKGSCRDCSWYVRWSEGRTLTRG